MFINVQPLQVPEVYLSNVTTLLDDQGNLVREDTKEFLRGFMAAFGKFVGN